MDVAAQLKQPRTQIAMVVLRAVPCRDHRPIGYQAGCPNCLTGEQAAAHGVPHREDELGVVADSHWSRLAAGLAARRTRLANGAVV